VHQRDAARPDRRTGTDNVPADAPARPPEAIPLHLRSAGNAAVARWMLARETPADGGTATAEPAAPQDTEKIAKLRKELSAGWDVDEEAVITQMAELSAAEVETVLADADLKAKAVGALDDAEMYRAVRAMHGDPAKSQEWLKAEGLPKYTFVKTAATELGTVKLDPALDEAVTKFVQHLLDNYLVTGNVVFDGIGGVREPETAHRNSTAYHIRTGVVTMDALKALPDGKDRDGNVWFKEGWTETEVKANALDVWDGEVANEGYGPADPKRLPNAAEVPMSTHCNGHAMDITIPWRDGDGWHKEARDLVKQFGLVRPFDPKERWHFELPGASP
jgi:hypothetical protein